MKKFLLMLALIVPMFAFTGCGGDDEPRAKFENWTTSELESVPSFVCKERRVIGRKTVSLKFQGGKVLIKADGERILSGDISYTVSGYDIEAQVRDIFDIELGAPGYTRKGFIYKIIQPNGDIELKIDIPVGYPADFGWWISDTYVESSEVF